MNKEKLEELERKYKRGLISYDEMEAITTLEEEKLNTPYDLLFDKLENEYQDFCREAKKEEPDEIVRKAYEITVKREILDELMNMDLYDEEMIIMEKQDGLLNDLYHDWLDTDVQLGDSIRDTITESVSDMTKYYYRLNKKEKSDDKEI